MQVPVQKSGKRCIIMQVVIWKSGEKMHLKAVMCRYGRMGRDAFLVYSVEEKQNNK